MSSANGSGDLSSEMEVDAFRRLFPLRFHERHLLESVRPDGMEGYWEKLEVQQWPLTMLAAIKMEVMTPTVDSQDEGYIALASSLAYFLLLFFLDIQPQMFWHDQYEGIITGQWESYLDGLTGNDIYCLDADGALLDTALLSAVAAFSNLQIPVVALNDDGRIVVMSEENEGGKLEKKPVNKEKRKLKLSSIPFTLTCILHKNYVLAHPTAEEESIMETLITVVINLSG
ncbi:unnamed protein product [Ilex paraguariensis]|uniref:Exoribonuclease phosphorolytic domain-containing protein n=1 Tax=Ilex paraguariensis TaxID=185542 RepID=A0ABC8SNR9_9AQUA